MFIRARPSANGASLQARSCSSRKSTRSALDCEGCYASAADSPATRGCSWANPIRTLAPSAGRIVTTGSSPLRSRARTPFQGQKRSLADARLPRCGGAVAPRLDMLARIGEQATWGGERCRITRLTQSRRLRCCFVLSESNDAQEKCPLLRAVGSESPNGFEWPLREGVAASS